MENTVNKSVDYSSITESPNLKATQEQLERLYQRYHFARQFAKDKDVLEVACGSGIGLGYLAKVAHRVVGVDIEEKNVESARSCYKEDEGLGGSEDVKFGRWADAVNEKLRSWEDGKQKIEDGRRKTEVRSHGTDNKCKIRVELMDAHVLNFPDKSFDLILLYEAIYYLKEPQKFIAEARRVLRKDGKLIICSVNKDWDDFHLSPYTHKYFSVPEYYEMFKDGFREVAIFCGFQVNNSGMKNRVVSLIKRMAVDFNLIPGSLKTRAYLKRIFMGKLVPLPAEVFEDMAPYEAPVPIPVDKINRDFKIIYAVAVK